KSQSPPLNRNGKTLEPIEGFYIHHCQLHHLDYCNSLLIGLPHRRLSRLQSIMNAAARPGAD
ncbi:unnamed protein product, partial [Staurois parvus]